MRNLVLLLLLANFIFFGWNRWVSEPPDDAATHFSSVDLEPRLDLLAAEGRREIASDGAGEVTDAGQSAATSSMDAGAFAAIAAAVGRPCVSIGPFRENDAAGDAVSRLQDLGNTASLRAAQGEIFLGHWVQIRNIPSRVESRRQLQTLRDGGIKDAYPVPEEDGERTLSLGLFSELDRAERLELQAKSLGLAAEILPHTKEATVFWADTRLSPGQDLRALEQLAGEAGTVMGDEAVCPRVP